MTLNFVKYQGTGNDFVLIDNRTGAWQAYLAMQVPQQFDTEKDLVAHLCHRQFGVGADGLMLLQNKEGFDFEMFYFNSDGGLSSMCG
jgi:diaminopimelate epimerase